MAIAKKFQPKLDSLAETLDMLVGGGLPLEQIKNMMTPKIKEFESEASVKLSIVSDEDGTRFDVLDLSKDFVRIRKQNEENKVVRAKVLGVGIDVKIFKKNEFNFTNEEMAAALRSLADELESLSVEVNTLDHADVRKDLEPVEEVESEEVESEEVESEEVESEEAESE